MEIRAVPLLPVALRHRPHDQDAHPEHQTRHHDAIRLRRVDMGQGVQAWFVASRGRRTTEGKLTEYSIARAKSLKDEDIKRILSSPWCLLHGCNESIQAEFFKEGLLIGSRSLLLESPQLRALGELRISTCSRIIPCADVVLRSDWRRGL